MAIQRLVVVFALLAWIVAGCTAAQAATASETLALIKKRGALVVGVKTDYAPFGMLDAHGVMQGMEHDMAADMARRLGVGLVRVPVSGANRLQKLEEGAVDIVIATMGDTAERRNIATVVEPNYYASGATLFMRPRVAVSDWQDIRGKIVCATQGSYFNRSMSELYLLDLMMFNNARDAKLAVRDGRCIGYLFDNTAIHGDLANPEWAGYQAPLPPALVVPWAVALARKEAGSEFEQWVGDVLADWHRSGFLIEREKAWGLAPSRFLADTHALWTRKTDDGRFVCERDEAGAWPAECRNRVFLSAQDLGGLQRLGLRIKELTGWDFTYIYDNYDRTRFLGGLLNTLILMVACVSASLLLGVLGALIAESRLRLLSHLVRGLAIFGRMTPPLLQMYLLLFGLGALVWTHYELSLSPWLVAIWCLSYYTGSSVMSALLDSCNFRRETRPDFRLQANTIALVYGPAAASITASLVNVSKATMMASVIAVPELLSVSTSILTDNGNVAEVMNMLLLVFLVLIAISIRLMGRLERKLRDIAARGSHE